MSGERVDVLAAIDAVTDWAREVSDQHIDGEDGLRQQYAEDLRNAREARAAVAELIRADREYDTAMRTEADTDGMLRREDARARRSAALSRIQPDGQGE